MDVNLDSSSLPFRFILIFSFRTLSNYPSRHLQTELVHESAQVLATTRTNVLAAHETLVAFLVEHAGGAELSGTAELAAAQEIVTKADELLAA